jgi:hypothetical protein
MNKSLLKLQRILTALLITGISVFALAPAYAEDLVKVTADNYVRAESDVQMKGYAEAMDAFGKFAVNRAHYDVDNQVTVRGNRDTIYMFGTFDLTSPLTITMPDPGERYMSLQVINQDHSIPPSIYGPAKTTFTMEEMGSRYILIGIRTFANPNDSADMKAAHALQDAVVVEQADIGKLELPNWDMQGVVTLRNAINVLNATMTDTSTMFGEKDKLNPIHHLLGTAFGWGGQPKKDAVYLNFSPEKNDGKTPYTLTVKDVPVDAFWSVIVYDSESWIPKNTRGIYSYNDITAKKAADGSITIHFGGDPKADNYLSIMEGWNYIVRLYQPKKAILDGSFTFPSPELAE